VALHFHPHSVFSWHGAWLSAGITLPFPLIISHQIEKFMKKLQNNLKIQKILPECYTYDLVLENI